MDLSPAELFLLALGGLLQIWLYIIKMNRRYFSINHKSVWNNNSGVPFLSNQSLLVHPGKPLSFPSVHSSPVLSSLVFTSTTGTVYTHTRQEHHSMAETLEHRILRSRKTWTFKKDDHHIPKKLTSEKDEREKDTVDVTGMKSSPLHRISSHISLKSPPTSPAGFSHKTLRSPTHSKILEIKSPTKVNEDDWSGKNSILPEITHISRPPRILECVPIEMPSFLFYTGSKIQISGREEYISSRRAAWYLLRHKLCSSSQGLQCMWYGSLNAAEEHKVQNLSFYPPPVGGLHAVKPWFGWSSITVPDKQTLVTDAGKLYVLDGLLKRLKEQGHRVLIYSQMTRMIDLLEEYMWHRKHTYMRLDGSSKISERRDMVADFQSRSDIFVFLLSTRAGGLGINLTAADTVIFYDSDWNPTVDQQAMDRAHRLGQTKQVTVYRLICKGTIEERILQRAREKSEIQRMVISGGNFKPDTLKPKEVVSLLLDDEEIERKYRQRQAEKRQQEETRADFYRERDKERKRKQYQLKHDPKRSRMDDGQDGDSILSVDSPPASPSPSEVSLGSAVVPQDETSNEGPLVVDVDSPAATPTPIAGVSQFSTKLLTRRPRPPRGTGRRGRPRGPGRRGGSGRGKPAPLPVRRLSHGDPNQPVKRGPGRPRLRPPGPGNQGTRHPPRPLPVPLSSTTLASPETSQSRPFGFYTQGPSD